MYEFGLWSFLTFLFKWKTVLYFEWKVFLALLSQQQQDKNLRFRSPANCLSISSEFFGLYGGPGFPDLFWMASIWCEANAGTVWVGPGVPDVLETGDEGSICVRRRRVALEHNRQHPLLLNTCYVYVILHCKKWCVEIVKWLAYTVDLSYSNV